MTTAGSGKAAAGGGGGVEFGIFAPQVAYSYEELLERAHWIEDLGFQSMWLMDHLYPPGSPGIASFEAWTLATALLASTTRLRIGHLVLCNSFRHPALLAKMATTLDVISDGRLILGLGSGSYEDEHHQAGMAWDDFRLRTARLGESLEVLTRMFADGRATFAGEHYAVNDLPNLPLPPRRPRPPILVGGAGERTLKLAATFADYWNCPTYALGRLDEAIARLHRACASVGRDPATIRLSVEAVLALAPSDDAVPDVLALAERRFGHAAYGLHDAGFVGTPETIAARVRELIDKGIRLFVFFMHDRVQRSTLELFVEKVLLSIPDHAQAPLP